MFDGALDDHELESISLRPRRGRRPIIAISAAILLGGMALAIIEAVSPSTPSNVEAKPSDVRADTTSTNAKKRGRAELPVAADESAEADTVSPEQLRSAAIAELRKLDKAHSSRVRRLAAMGLARIDDADAIATLRTMLAQEKSRLNQIQIAYALARSGDAEGSKILLGGLNAKRRDVRLDAATALVRLGDDRGKPQLLRMLSLSSHRIGAAGLLARLGDERGVAVLQKTLATGTNEAKMRAAVALGLAGHESVRETLKSILGDSRYNVGAAAALAAIGDDTAVEALERQLQTTAMCGQAALALRRMDHKVDLTRLAATLANGDDAARVSAAEAILILTGTKKAAERD